MSLPESSYFPLTEDLSICRVLNGMWQVSGAHGAIEAQPAIAAMFPYVEAGFTTWDLADHYGPAEDFIGEFRRRLRAERGEAALAQVQAFTKWVPRPMPITRRVVEENIQRSRQRMAVDALDLLQFHWWDYSDRNYLEALRILTDLKTEGWIKQIALTNFDTAHTKTILEQGFPIVSNQVQFSLIDRRPLKKMASLCQQSNVKLLAYGTLCGGLLSEKYVGVAEPNRAKLNTASLRKYKNMIDAWGSWDLFQKLLLVLQKIAQKHGVTIPNVAVRYVLEQPAVAGVIVGVRLGVSEHLQENAQVFNFSLDTEDYDRIAAVLEKSQDLYRLIGDCGDEYR